MSMKRIYTYDEDFFSRKNPETFYWAGFLAADGCVAVVPYSIILRISLAIKDKDHLIKFKKAINFSGPIREHSHHSDKSEKWHKACGITLTITNTRVIKDLEKFNIVPRKTKTYSFPKWLINHPLVNHFIRGYFDGDGSVCAVKPSPSGLKRKAKSERLQVTLVGNRKFLRICNNIINKNCGYTTERKISWGCGVWRLSFCGNRLCMKVAKFMYRGSTDKIKLERKYKRFYNGFFDNMPESFISKPISATNITTREIIFFKSTSDALRQLGGGWAKAIRDCVNGKRENYKGCVWKYSNK